jgi:hypothetical protein
VRRTRKTSSQTSTKAIQDIKERREGEEGRDVVLPSSLIQLKQEEKQIKKITKRERTENRAFIGLLVYNQAHKC